MTDETTQREAPGLVAEIALQALVKLSAEEAARTILQALRNRPELALPVVEGACPELTYAPATALTCPRSVGRIKSFNHNNGYGFIACPELHEKFGCDVFLHRAQFTGFVVDQEVNFAVLLNKRQRPQAFDLIAGVGANAALAPPPGCFSAATQSNGSSSSRPHDAGQTNVGRPVPLGVFPAAPNELDHKGSPRLNIEQRPLNRPLTSMLAYRRSFQPPGHATAVQCPAAQARQPQFGVSSNSLPSGNLAGGVCLSPKEEAGKSRSVPDSLAEAKAGVPPHQIPQDKDGLFYKRYRGRIKSLKSDSFGFIECAELFDIFKRDVFLQPSQLKDCEVGADVTFSISLNGKGQPQALKIKEASSGTKTDEAGQDSKDADRQADQVFEGAVCIICREVLHRATSVQPCLHSFCSACLGGWLGRAGPGSSGCPICREPVVRASRNHTLDGLINGLLKAHPSRQRSAQDIEELDARDVLHHVGYDLDLLVSNLESPREARNPWHGFDDLFSRDGDDMLLPAGPWQATHHILAQRVAERRLGALNLAEAEGFQPSLQFIEDLQRFAADPVGFPWRDGADDIEINPWFEDEAPPTAGSQQASASAIESSPQIPHEHRRSPSTSPDHVHPPWTAHWSEEHDAYYFYNVETSESTWQKPRQWEDSNGHPLPAPRFFSRTFMERDSDSDSPRGNPWIEFVD